MGCSSSNLYGATRALGSDMGCSKSDTDRDAGAAAVASDTPSSVSVSTPFLRRLLTVRSIGSETSSKSARSGSTKAEEEADADRGQFVNAVVSPKKSSEPSISSSELSFKGIEEPRQPQREEVSGPRGLLGPEPQLRRSYTSFTMSSETDDGFVSFAEKSQMKIGASVDPEDRGIYVTCRKGRKPESPNQDSWYILRDGDFSIYAVFDGHGKKGHHISNFVKDRLPELIMEDSRFRTTTLVPMVLQDAFREMACVVRKATDDRIIDAARSGTTATVLIHDHVSGTLTASHVGDSGAALVRGRNFKSRYLTPDHKPNLPMERARIEGAGGTIRWDGYQWRAGTLNLSRTFGDLNTREAGVVSDPDVSQTMLTSKDQFLLVCSDGVWEFIRPQDAADIAQKALASGENPVNALALAAAKRWSEEHGMYVDDITSLLIRLGDDDINGRPLQSGVKRQKSTTSVASTLSHNSSTGTSETPTSRKQGWKRALSGVLTGHQSMSSRLSPTVSSSQVSREFSRGENSLSGLPAETNRNAAHGENALSGLPVETNRNAAQSKGPTGSCESTDAPAETRPDATTSSTAAVAEAKKAEPMTPRDAYDAPASEGGKLICRRSVDVHPSYSLSKK